MDESEYTINQQLGFISLNQSLNNDEILGIAFQYTYQGKFSKSVSSHQTTDSSFTTSNSALILKMLKSNLNDVSQPVFKLMMKNIYDLGIISSKY